MMSKTRYVLLGASGMLGGAFARRFEAESVEVAAYDRAGCDVTSLEDLQRLPLHEGVVVINCTAWADVDGAETNEAAATRVNGEGVGMLAKRCHQAGATLVHYSTDYVFPGNATSPYLEDANRSPVNAYGRSKARGEELALEATPDGLLLLRTSWLYGATGSNFVRTMLRLGMQKSELKVVDDQRGRPTSVDSLVDVTLQLLRSRARGIYHATDGGECTWHGLASEIFRIAGMPTRVLPCTSDEFPRPAARPSYSVLGLEKTEASLGRLPAWQGPLERVVARVLAAGVS